MSQPTQEQLEDRIKACFYTYNIETSAGGMDEEKALNYQVAAITALIQEARDKGYEIGFRVGRDDALGELMDICGKKIGKVNSGDK